MKIISKVLLAMLLMTGMIACDAEVPVVDLSEDQSNTSSTANSAPASTPQAAVEDATPTTDDSTPIQQYNDGGNSNAEPTDRLAKLEKQMSYLQQMNVITKINSLEQSIQDLHGLLEIQAHQIQDLQMQIRSQYSDLNRRLSAAPTKSSYSNHPSSLTSSPVDTSTAVTVPVATKKNLPSADKEVSVYANAFNLIKKKQYADAITGLQIYLKEYPNGQYVASAHYWLGELLLISGNANQAKAEFTIVTQQYADSDKVADALFKLGSLAYDQSNFAEAKKNWQTLVNQYPDSSAARIAATRLDQLSQQGH